MSSSHPYLLRRGDSFYFRIAVPLRLREAVGMREITSALGTRDRAVAVPRALIYGATVLRLFNEVGGSLTAKDMLELLAQAREKLRHDARAADLEAEVWAAHEQRIADVRRANLEAGQREAILQAELKTLREALATVASGRATTAGHVIAPAPVHPAAPLERVQAPREQLGKLVDAYLGSYQKDKKPGMFKKVKPALILLKQLHGTTHVDQLRQADIVDYFDVVETLPPRWQDRCKKLKVTPRELGRMDHAQRLGKKTFDDNYLVPVRLFLKWARTRWQDQGFPSNLTTEGIEFSGEDDEGDNKQRAMTHDELAQLFHRALAPYRADKDQDHKWWLPALEFYTGARVNELCQLNPQVDIGTEAGIPYILITDETEADDRIRKSVKTGDERKVPLHPELVQAGFLEYVDRIQKGEHKLLFPKWTPTNNRASTQAEKWFRVLLRETGLRDETPGKRLVGFHAFRHTLLARASNSSPQVDAGPLTGHADGSRSGTQRGYEGELSLERKLERLKAIQFGFDPFA